MKKIKSMGHIEKYKISVITILLAVSCFLTCYFHSVHGIGTVFSHFFYIPIILSSLWWKRKGLLVALFLAALLIFSHIFLREDVVTVNDYFRSILLMVIAFVVAFLSERIAKTEEKMKESEDFSSSLSNNSPDPIIVIKPDASIKYVNPALERLTGFSSAELIGKKAPYPWWTKETLQKTSNEFEEALHRGANKLEKLFQKKNSERFWVEITSTSVNVNGAFNYYLANWVNITKRKKAEETINNYQEQLKSLVSELIKTEDNLRHQIASNLHDRISQNLAVLKFKLELLNEDLSAAGHAGDLNEILKLIEQTIHETYSLVYELTPPILNELGLEPAVEWLTELFQKKHGIAVEFHRDIQSKPLSDDQRGLLFQAVRELLVNITKHARASKAKVTITRDSNNINVSVNDDGDGFDTASLGVNNGETGGFGLFSIRERLSHLGGRLDIQSRPGRGSRFILTLPLKRQEIETPRK